MKNKLLYTLLLILVQTTLLAVTKTYIGTNGSWNTAGNWSPSGVPTAADEVIIPTQRTVNITGTTIIYAYSVTISGTLNMGDNSRLDVTTDFTVNTGGIFNMPSGNGLATLVVYGNYINNGTSAFWKSTVIIVGNLISPSTSTIQNNGNVVVGGNIIGVFDTTGGNGTGQIYAVNPSATVTITPTSIDNNVIPGTLVTNENPTLINLVNLIIYGGNCPFNSGTPNVTVCSGSNATFSVTTTASAPTYQWQVNSNNGSGWVDLSNSAPYSGVTSATLTITAVTTAMNTNKYRVKITAAGCSKYGIYGVLTVTPGVSAPIIGTITAPSCGNADGSIQISGLPASGTWTLTRNGSSSAVTTGTGTTTTVSGLSAGTYTFTVSNGTCTSPTSANAVVATITNTWNGTVWSTGSAPTISQNVIINGNLTVTSNLNGCAFQILSGNLIITSPYVLTITNAINVSSGSLTIENGASLVQTNNDAINTGNIILKRNTTIRNTDYVYWSSPVANFSAASISSGTSTSLIYKWNPTFANTNGTQGNWVSGNEIMSLGKGYIVRGPNSYTSTPSVFTATFTGIPNNGTIQTNIVRGTNTVTNDDNWNLVGNPYPSAIDALAFLTLNNSKIVGNVRLWTHNTAIGTTATNPFYQNFAYNYSTADYVNFNGTGSNPPGFNGKIGAGQGFFVMMDDDAGFTNTVTFNNSLRNSTYSNTQFYRTNDSTENTSTETEKSRIWLSLVNSNNVATTTLIGYIDGASNEKDYLYDTSFKTGINAAIFSVVEDKPMIIQGRSTPFDTADMVSIGVTIPSNGLYTIAISELDGLFSDANQAIYLEDVLLGITHDLRNVPYTFSGTTGTITNRFVLRYNETTALGIDTNNTNQTFAFVSNNQLQVQATETISKIEIYDITGKMVKEYQPSEAKNTFTAEFNYANGAYITKMTLENGIIISKKVMR